MFMRAITTIGMCVIGGKYILMLILAAITISTGSVQADVLSLTITDVSE